jgi:uncharacterized protein
MPIPPPAPLTNREIAVVERQLVRGRSPLRNFEMLDGFFAALVTGPELLMPSEYLPLVLGDPEDAEVERPTDMEEVQRFLDLIMRHWNLMVETFMAGRPWQLHLSATKGGRKGQLWAQGFEAGAGMLSGWDQLTRQKSHQDLLGSVIWLANEGAADRARRSPPFTPELREDMLGAIAGGLPLLYAATRPGATPRRPPAPGRRARSTKPKPKPRRRR